MSTITQVSTISDETIKMSTFDPMEGIEKKAKETNDYLLKRNKEIEAARRKRRPVLSGVINYFPDAILEISEVSLIGNEQHHPGTPLHWDRAKSTDEGDALVRHLMEAGTRDIDGVRHSAKAAWRALALLQKEIESERQELKDFI